VRPGEELEGGMVEIDGCDRLRRGAVLADGALQTARREVGEGAAELLRIAARAGHEEQAAAAFENALERLAHRLGRLAGVGDHRHAHARALAAWRAGRHSTMNGDWSSGARRA
jgi:hypothetical protein